MVRNVTKKMKRIKIKPPTGGKFFCDYVNTGPLAPGLSMELVISFKTNEEGSTFTDEVLIIPEGEEPRSLKLLAFLKAWHVLYPPFVNFGFVQPSKPTAKEIEFSNEGDNPAAVAVTVVGGDTSVMVENGVFELKRKERRKVTTTLTAQGTAELITKALNVTVGGELRDPIALNAVVVRQVLSVVFANGAGQASEISFGTLFFGETREVDAVLVNNGPDEVRFNITFSRDHDRDKEGEGHEDLEVKAPRDFGREMMDRVMTVVPISATVAPYSDVTLALSR